MIFELTVDHLSSNTYYLKVYLDNDEFYLTKVKRQKSHNPAMNFELSKLQQNELMQVLKQNTANVVK